MEQKIIQGDAMTLLKEIPSESIDVIIADPPYNLGKNYGNNHDFKEFDDYISFSKTWLGEAKRILKSTVHYCNENRQKHPTQKPEGLIERMILASSDKGEQIFDPFSGSGTTVRVCQQLERNATGFELNPDYVRMTKERLAQPFNGFDSIDPRMKRVPNDLNDFEMRENYLKN